MAGRVEQNNPGGKADASGTPEDDEDDWDMLTKLRNTSERVNESSKRRNREYSPGWTQVESDDPDDDAVVSTMSGSIEDVGMRPKKLSNASERERKRSKRRSRKDSAGRPGGEPDEPRAETAVSGDIHNLQKRPRKVSNERVDETDAPGRDRPPGGHRGEQEVSRAAKGDPDRTNVVDHAGYDGRHPRSRGNERVVETSALRQVRGPGGYLDERAESGDVGDYQMTQSGGDGVQGVGKRGGKNGATSNARRESKGLETRSLAEDESSQQELDKGTKRDIPEPSQLPINHPGGPTEHVNPPRRRGRLKSCTRKIRRSTVRRSTHQVVPPCRGQSGRIVRIGYVAYTVQRLGEHPTATMNKKDRPSDDPGGSGVERRRGRSGPRKRCRPRRIRWEPSQEQGDGDANPPGRDRGPGGQLGEQVESGANEGGRERQNDGDGGQTDKGPGGKDGATSGARRDSKRVDTTPLTAGKPGQRGRRKRETADVPEASTPPTIDPRRSTDHLNPPRRRGRLKTRARSISTRKWTYQVERSR